MGQLSQEILVCSENPDLLKELLGKARQFAEDAGWTVSALLLAEADENLASYGAYGADLVVRASIDPGSNPEVGVSILTQVLNVRRPALTLIGATNFGLEIAPRIAERVKSGYAAWVVDFRLGGNDQVKVKSMLFSGVGLATYHFKPEPLIISAAPGTFEALEPGDTEAQVVPVDVSPSPVRMTILETQKKTHGGARLEEADLVIDTGQGLKNKEDLEMIQALADLLDGKLGCTRPLASDRDWFPEWLGLSGVKISPDLCLTVGVSGQVQHIVGIRNSRLIAAVNNDENAAIFTQADYGVVADLYEFIPALIERIKARGVKPAWLE